MNTLCLIAEFHLPYTERNAKWIFFFFSRKMLVVTQEGSKYFWACYSFKDRLTLRRCSVNEIELQLLKQGSNSLCANYMCTFTWFGVSCTVSVLKFTVVYPSSYSMSTVYIPPCTTISHTVTTHLLFFNHLKVEYLGRNSELRMIFQILCFLKMFLIAVHSMHACMWQSSFSLSPIPQMRKPWENWFKGCWWNTVQFLHLNGTRGTVFCTGGTVLWSYCSQKCSRSSLQWAVCRVQVSEEQSSNSYTIEFSCTTTVEVCAYCSIVIII